MGDLIATGALLIMGAILAFQSVLHHRERRDLYTRIQAGTLPAYVEATAPKEPPPKGRSHTRAVMEQQRGQGE